MFTDNRATRQRRTASSKWGAVLALAVATALALLLAGPLAGQAQAADLTAGSAVQAQATKYNVWVGGKRVTSANASNVLGDGHVSYNAKTKTLTLKNARVKKGSFDGDELHSISYNLSGTFTIKLVGKNVISAPKTSSAPKYAFGIVDASENKARLRLTGSGSLTVRAAGASFYSEAIAVWKGVIVQDKVKLYCYGGASTEKSTGIDVQGGLTVKGSAKVVAYGETGAFAKAPKFSGYTPKVKAGYSSSDIRVSKNKPASSVYTKYPYVSIAKAAGSSSSSGSSGSSSSSKAPAKMTITKLERLEKQFLVHWTPLTKNCSGYQLQVSEYKSFPKNKTRFYSLITDKKYKGAYAWGLTAGKRYYVRVRAYHKTGGTTYWGAYSNVKSAVAKGSSTSVG